MRVILVCHGESEIGTLQTSVLEDALLSELDARRASAIALELRDNVARRQPVEAIYSSPLAPALKTASMVADELNLPPPDRRCTLPALSSRPAREADAASSLDLLRAVQAGAWEAIEAFRRTHAEGAQIVAVTDRLTIHAIVCRALSISIEEFRRFRIDTGSMTTVAFRQQRTLLASLNETCHLNGIDG